MDRSVYIAELLIKKLRNELTAAESMVLEDWLLTNDANHDLLNSLTDEEKLRQDLKEYTAYNTERVRTKIDLLLKKQAGLNPNEVKNIYEPLHQRVFVNQAWFKYAAAAILLVACYAFYDFFWAHNTGNVINPALQTVVVENDLLPGSDKAILTLSDGQQVVLDSNTSNNIYDSGISIASQKGLLVYTGENNNKSVAYNTISTPKGGQYKVMLSDGTAVWLNAASSLKYPTRFRGALREVEISGEVYFEVTADRSHPFIVRETTGGMRIQVTGTHFNVNTYKDEGQAKITLLEGGIKVSDYGQERIITPGQQAKVSASGITVMADVDIDEVMAWKNGKFDFGEKANIETIMKQLARWYDVDVEYQGKVNRFFWGSISREVNASEVFNMLEETGAVKFRIEDKKVIVMP